MRRLVLLALFAAGLVLPLRAFADPYEVFDVHVVFAGGDVLSGTASIADRNAYQITPNLQLTDAGALVTTFTDSAYFTPFLVFSTPPQNPTTTGIIFQSQQGYVQLIVHTGYLTEVVETSDPAVCLVGSGCSYGLATEESVPRSGGPYPAPELGVGPAVSGTFTLERPASAVPEPGTFWLLGGGLAVGAVGLRRLV